jgi:hypothetical protein
MAKAFGLPIFPRSLPPLREMGGATVPRRGVLQRREDFALPGPLEVIEEIQSITIEVAAIEGFPHLADETPKPKNDL